MSTNSDCRWTDRFHTNSNSYFVWNYCYRSIESISCMKFHELIKAGIDWKDGKLYSKAINTEQLIRQYNVPYPRECNYFKYYKKWRIRKLKEFFKSIYGHVFLPPRILGLCLYRSAVFMGCLLCGWHWIVKNMRCHGDGNIIHYPYSKIRILATYWQRPVVVVGMCDLGIPLL